MGAGFPVRGGVVPGGHPGGVHMGSDLNSPKRDRAQQLADLKNFSTKAAVLKKDGVTSSVKPGEGSAGGKEGVGAGAEEGQGGQNNMLNALQLDQRVLFPNNQTVVSRAALLLVQRLELQQLRIQVQVQILVQLQ